jgi:hypothetical protein
MRAMSRRTEEDLGTRVARLELTLLEVVTALGMLVGELALRDDLALEQPGLVEDALDRGWQTLFGGAAGTEFLAEAPAADAAGSALQRAMVATGAAVGAIYAFEGGTIRLVTSVGYPAAVIEQFRTFPLDADLPVAEVARTGRPLWFEQRDDILERYPDLLDAHERTEEALGRRGVQGAVIPLIRGQDRGSVLLIGFAEGGEPDRDRRRRLDALRADFDGPGPPPRA